LQKKGTADDSGERKKKKMISGKNDISLGRKKRLLRLHTVQRLPNQPGEQSNP